MTLTTAGKDYIAEHFGLSNCFAKTGLSWTRYDLDGTNTAETGGTVKLINRITETGIVDYIRIGATNYYYTDLKAANGDNDITLDDITWIAAHDDPSDSPPNPYCTGAPPPTGFLTVNTSPTGASVSIDGTSCGTTPVTACVVPVGTGKTVTITKTGYQTETRTVNITEGATTNLGTITLTPTAAPGKGTLYLGTDPYCCKAWIDADPAVDPPTVACTKDKTISPGYDTILLDAPATHTLHVRKTGYENFYTEFELIGEGDSWFEMMDPMKPLAGTDVAMLTVNAYKDEEKPGKVPIDNAVLKKGTSKVGFCPYSDYWRADPGGTNYNISVVAEGRATHLESIVLYKDTPKTIDAYLPEKRLAVIIKIAAGLAYIDDISGGDYQVWYIGTRIEGWVRVETFIDKPTMFKAELTLCAPGTTTPVAGISKIITEEKLLHPSMSASDRHLDWPLWLVPDKPGEYSLVAELFMMT